MVSAARGDGESPTVRESVAPLPFHAGGSLTLTAGAISDLVRVRDLRRFESLQAYIRGLSTAVNGLQFIDAAADYLAWGVQIGDILYIDTDGTTHTITAVVSSTELQLDFAAQSVGEGYVISKPGNERPTAIRKFSLLTDGAVYVRYDGAPDEMDGFDVEIGAGEGYFEENVYIVSRIAVVAVDAAATPKVRFTAWGV